MSAIGPGDLVRCVKCEPDRVGDFERVGGVLPIVGRRYTVKWTGANAFGAPAITVHELQDTLHGIGCCFPLHWFAKWGTDISLFKAMLNKPYLKPGVETHETA